MVCFNPEIDRPELRYALTEVEKREFRYGYLYYLRDNSDAILSVYVYKSLPSLGGAQDPPFEPDDDPDSYKKVQVVYRAPYARGGATSILEKYHDGHSISDSYYLKDRTPPRGYRYGDSLCLIKHLFKLFPSNVQRMICPYIFDCKEVPED